MQGSGKATILSNASARFTQREQKQSSEIMYLLDTNHCSRLLQGHLSVTQKLEELGDVLVATCVIVCGELIFMVCKSERRDENLRHIEWFLRDIQVFPVDEQTADIYGRLKCAVLDRFAPRERAKRRKTKTEKLGFSENDLWIAGTAKRYGLTVVSLDSDFERMQEVDDISLERWLSPRVNRLPTEETEEDEEEIGH